MLNTRIGENYNANDVLNPNDLRRRLLNVDSRFRTVAADPAGDFQFRLEHTYKNVIRMRVSSVELPIGATYAFSAKRQNTTFTVATADIGDVPRTFTVAVADGNYTAEQLIDAVQDELDVVGRDTYGIFVEATLDPNSRKVSLVNRGVATVGVPAPTAAARPTTFSFGTTPPSIYNSGLGLGYNLGFRSATYVATLDGAEYVADGQAVISVAPDSYLLLGVNDLHTVEHKTRGNYFQTLAKVLVCGDGRDNCCITNEIVFPQPQDFTVLQVQLRDPLGGVVDLNGLDYSFTLEITEVQNTRLYDFYRNYIWLGTVPTAGATKGMGSTLLGGGR
jgi:hypothetical protein